MAITTVEAFGELVGLCKESVEVRALVRKFLDEGGVLGGLEINQGTAAGSGAGQIVMNDKPSDELLCCLAAARASHEITGSFGGIE